MTSARIAKSRNWIATDGARWYVVQMSLIQRLSRAGNRVHQGQRRAFGGV